MQQQVKSKGYIKLFFEVIVSAFKSIFSTETYYNDKEHEQFIENITNGELRDFELIKLQKQRKPLLQVSIIMFFLSIISYFLSSYTALLVPVFIIVSNLWALNNIKHKIILLKLAQKLDKINS